MLRKLLCWLGWHGKTEERVFWQGSAGVRALADYCSACGHCYVEITPQMRHVLGKHHGHEPSWSKACIEDLKKIKWLP